MVRMPLPKTRLRSPSMLATLTYHRNQQTRGWWRHRHATMEALPWNLRVTTLVPWLPSRDGEQLVPDLEMSATKARSRAKDDPSSSRLQAGRIDCIPSTAPFPHSSTRTCAESLQRCSLRLSDSVQQLAHGDPSSRLQAGRNNCLPSTSRAQFRPVGAEGAARRRLPAGFCTTFGCPPTPAPARLSCREHLASALFPAFVEQVGAKHRHVACAVDIGAQ